MTLVYMDGWDLDRTTVAGLDIGNEYDNGIYWAGGSFNTISFATGKDDGWAMFADTDVALANRFTIGSTTIRAGFWARLNDTSPTGNSTAALVQVGSSNDYQEPGNGNFYAAYNIWIHNTQTVSGTIQTDLTIRNGLTSGQTWTWVDPENSWHYFEYVVDTMAGTQALYIDKVLTLSATGGDTNGAPAFMINNTMNGLAIGRWQKVIDHLWITTGEQPWSPTETNNDQVLAVQVQASFDLADAKGHGRFTGHIDFETDPDDWTLHGTSISLSLGNDDYGVNVNWANTGNWLWDKDPRTNSAWTEGRYAQIQSFGVCYTSASDPDYARLLAVGLSRLVYNNGMPLIKTARPSSNAVFSAGTWVKSDSTLSYTGHVRELPRRNETDLDTSTYLSVNSDGCIAFGVGGDSDDTDTANDQFTKVGITFAEEFRTDNLDWVRLLGSNSGLNYNSYFKAAYSLPGGNDRKFQDNYVTINYENVPNGQAYMQGLWDFSTYPDTGRWSMRQLIYADPYASGNYKHGFRKIKVRGNGRAMQLYVTSKANSPFKINGWTIFVTLNQAV